jgi:putative PIN family toxin of toxin-antitoxin system
MSLPVFVVDTNVLVSGLIAEDRRGPVACILDAMLMGRLLYLVSPALLDEYRSVLLRPRLARLHGLAEPEIDTLLTELVSNAIWRETCATAAAPDPGDDHLWALLAAHPGSILVTGDALLLAHPPDSVTVVTPRTCAERFLPGS